MTLDECDLIFDRVLSSSSVDEARATLSQIMLPSLYPIMSVDVGGGPHTLWRGRRCCGGRRFSHVSELGCPPPDLADIGRLNDRGVPCLYAATKVETVFAELDPKPGELLQVIGIRPIPGANIRFIALGELFHVYRSGSTKMFGSGPASALARFINEGAFNERQRALYIDAFLGDVLSDQHAHEKQYVPSRAIASVAYTAITPAEGFYYPSVRTVVGTNVTMKAATYREKCRIVCAQLIQIDKPRRFGFYDHKVISEVTGIAGDGELVWAEPTEGRATFFNLTKDEADSTTHTTVSP